MPIWKNAGPSAYVLNDAEVIQHNGIKLLYNATWVSSAKPSDILDFSGLGGYNYGQTGSLLPNKGVHTNLALAQFNKTQNNGTTTFIGNDILNAQLVQGNQNIGANADSPGINEENFDGTNNSNPWTRLNNSLTNWLKIGDVQMTVSVSGTIAGTIDSTFIVPANGPFLGFVMWEMGLGINPPPAGLTFNNVDRPLMKTVPGGTGMIYTTIYKIPLTSASTTVGDFFGSADVTIKANCCYVFGIIFDNDITAGGPGLTSAADISNLKFSDLQFSVISKFDSGASGIPIPAPSLNSTVFAGFRLGKLLSKIVPFFATRNADDYGFPIPATTPYVGSSTFLNNASLPPIGDIVPYQLFLTSAYCIHDLAGLSYVTISFNELFDFCKKQLGCGCQVTGNTLSIEDLSTFFDSSTMILDLGNDVVDFEDSQLTEGLGANLKLGYTKADINSDFGVDAFNTEIFFNTPLSNIPAIMDYEETAILSEMYAIEKLRAQKVSQPAGTAFDPANPSGDNQSVILYCQNTTVDVYGQFFDPINNPISPTAAFPVKVFGDAQSTDPTAASATYIHGLYYPDTAVNVPLSPCRALQRSTGRLLHSVLDIMDADYLVYRNFGIMQYNNQVVDVTGIESNLDIGSGSAGLITEFKNIQIGNLPPKLFRPIIFKVKSKYPVNLYQILNTNPNGYIRFFWTNVAGTVKEYKMFLTKATQAAGTNAATVFEGWATPDMVL